MTNGTASQSSVPCTAERVGNIHSNQSLHPCNCVYLEENGFVVGLQRIGGLPGHGLDQVLLEAWCNAELWWLV
jgi:hypothetical protein